MFDYIPYLFHIEIALFNRIFIKEHSNRRDILTSLLMYDQREQVLFLRS